ncbi:hypothetical protein GECvBMG_gp077c [Salmonella phage GEC_vB_MG]|nr:hypothetical protein GECvBMG_gp077c [Salmonella phage GEC_vB_MG]
MLRPCTREYNRGDNSCQQDLHNHRRWLKPETKIWLLVVSVPGN